MFSVRDITFEALVGIRLRSNWFLISTRARFSCYRRVMSLFALVHARAKIGLQISDLVEINSSTHLKFQLAFLALVKFCFWHFAAKELGIEVVLVLLVLLCRSGGSRWFVGRDIDI